MTISKNILTMTPAELTQWVAERRALRLTNSKERSAKRPRPQTVAKLATELGVDISKVLTVLEEK